MPYKKYLLENTFVIISGFALYLADYFEFNDAYIKAIIILLSLIKSFYFIVKILKGISEPKSNFYYHQYLVFLALNFCVIVVSFAVDYICLYYIDNNSFSGLPEKTFFFDIIFKLFHFSILIFSNIGIVKIIPESNTANVLMMFESILSFATILFFLSDFVSLKESLEKRNKNSN